MQHKILKSSLSFNLLSWNSNNLDKYINSKNVSALSTMVCCSGSSAGKEFTCNAEEPVSIHGSGKCTGEGIGYPLQYFWTSLVDQKVKDLPAMQKTWFWSLGWEDILEKGPATHSSILVWKIPWTTGLQRVRHNWATFTFSDRKSKTWVTQILPTSVNLFNLSCFFLWFVRRILLIWSISFW